MSFFLLPSLGMLDFGVMWAIVLFHYLNGYMSISGALSKNFLTSYYDLLPVLEAAICFCSLNFFTNGYKYTFCFVWIL